MAGFMGGIFRAVTAFQDTARDNAKRLGQGIGAASAAALASRVTLAPLGAGAMASMGGRWYALTAPLPPATARAIALIRGAGKDSVRFQAPSVATEVLAHGTLDASASRFANLD